MLNFQMLKFGMSICQFLAVQFFTLSLHRHRTKSAPVAYCYMRAHNASGAYCLTKIILNYGKSLFTHRV